jgi:hypothetical protein
VNFPCYGGFLANQTSDPKPQFIHNYRRSKYYRRYLVADFDSSHNDEMGLSLVFFVSFLQKIAVGAGAVLALLVAIWLGIPRRSVVVANRRITR